MINRIIAWSVHNRVLVILLSVLLTAAGLVSLKNTAVDAIPDLSDVQVIIKTSYPGQSAEVVEQQVTYPLTNAMLSVPKTKTVRGFSFFGDSYIYIIFEDDTDMYWARSRVLEYLNQVNSQLPSSAKSSLGPDATGVGWVYLYALINKNTVSDSAESELKQHDLSELTSLQNWYLKPELQSVAGVSEIATLGGMAKQYQVTIDPFKLRQYQVPLSHVINAIKQSNQTIGAAVVEMAEAEYIVTSEHYLASIEDIQNIAIGISRTNTNTTSTSTTAIFLKDIAEVKLTNQMRRGIAEFNGLGEAVAGIVVMRFGENAQQVIKNVEAKLAKLKQGLPDGVELVTVYNRANLIDNAINNLTDKLSEELFIVSLVCLLFLWHLPSAIVAVVSLPLGILSAFIIMQWQGINANIMSLAGIAIAIGAMTDGAIVMIENYHKHLSRFNESHPNNKLEEEKRWQLLLTSTQEVGPALFFSLLIITISFLPVFMLEAQEGRLFAPLAYTKTFAMAASAGLAISLIPVLMGYLIRGKIRSEKQNPINQAFIALYQPLLGLCLRMPKTVIGTAIILVLVSYYPLNKLSNEFMPELDEGDIMYMPTTYPAISIAKAQELLQQTNKLIKTIPEVETVLGKIGRAETATDPAPLTMIESFIHLKPQSQWREGMTKQKLMAELEQLIKFPGLSNAWVMPIKTRIDMLATGIKTSLGLRLLGEDLSVLNTLSEQIEQLLLQEPSTRSVYAEQTVSGRYLDISLDDIKLANYGINAQEVQQVIAHAIGGNVLTQTVEGLARYPISLRFYQDFRSSPEAIEQLFFTSSKGDIIQLADIATIAIKQGPAMIKSENARLTATLLIEPNHDDISAYIEQIEQHISEHITLPAGYNYQWAGQYEYQQRVANKLQLVIPLTLILIVILLYLNFKKMRDVLLILTTLPFALIGGFWLMYLLDFKFSIAVAVGFIALAGVAIELGVIMIVYLKQAIIDAQQDLKPNQNSELVRLNSADLRQAITNGAAKRIRAILMTVTTIIIGLIPILTSEGTGSEIMSRIAAPMVGGMLSALILTLFVLPCVYLMLYKPNKC
ncbi:efflux RND transporter permease subunit [Thalassotalea agariperforans]